MGMKNSKRIRYLVIAALLFLGACWSVASAVGDASENSYPNARFLASARWLQSHRDDPDLLIVDVRSDKYYDGKLIPGAVRMPWKQFRYNDVSTNRGGLFVGLERAQEILGAHGVARNDTVVLYDSVERDGGATCSYIFWVLDLLGHRNMKILERGIDAWMEAGGKTVSAPRNPEPVLYQAPSDEIKHRKSVEADFIMVRLGDPYYQILDVRSRGEYLGEKPNVGLDGSVLKLGHVPTAYNIDYVLNWVDTDTKTMKSYEDLLKLYRGLDPDRAVITYCHSARRGAFGYFVLRLMGLEDVMLYEPSWMEWGNRRYYYPVETSENIFEADTPPRLKGTPAAVGDSLKTSTGRAAGRQSPVEKGSSAKSGYISCGG
jgi:thiosulfate/3-mercaptopyruvate sulfurtransferase